MKGIRSGINLEFNYQNKDAKIKVSPVGDVVGFDGRAFRIDGSALIADIAKNGLHIVLDENHWDGRAMGWFDKNTFELKDDGIYAALELTEDGEKLIASKAYRYLSPTYIMDYNTRAVLSLDSVALVNRPNLLNQQLNKKGENLEELEDLRAKNAALQKELNELKSAKETNAKKESDGTDALIQKIKELEDAQNALKEQNAKIASFFGKMELEQNSNNSKSLTDGEMAVAKMLGISEDEYARNKQGGN